MMLQWTWPFAKSKEISSMLGWICCYELEKICFPEPQLIQAVERRRILALFKVMDRRRCGFCSYHDIAGGVDGVDRDEMINVVDARTVREVCGDIDMDMDSFLELMCEDGYRGHEEAKRACLKDGRSIICQVREVVGFRGWLLEKVPPHEESPRRVADALEAEALRWKVASEKPQEGEAVRPMQRRATVRRTSVRISN